MKGGISCFVGGKRNVVKPDKGWEEQEVFD